jgi:hypothetical protein
MYMSVYPGRSSTARSIREHLRKKYFEPARRRHESLVTVRAGDIHRELGLQNRVPNVCQVMESKLLEKEANVKVTSKQGPPSGRGTTVRITYAVDLTSSGSGAKDAGPSPIETASKHPGVELFLALRGLGAETYASAGGGEAWLNAERAAFYGPIKKDLE